MVCITTVTDSTGACEASTTFPLTSCASAIILISNIDVYKRQFYYSIIENKFFINDGYPDIAVLGSLTEIQKIRDENMQAIANEWDKFIGYMKKVNKYKE